MLVYRRVNWGGFFTPRCPKKPPRKDRNIRIFQGWGGLRVLHFQWLLGEYRRWWYMAETYLLLIFFNQSVELMNQCPLRMKHFQTSQEWFEVWDLMIPLFSHWNYCCRKGWRNKKCKDCMTWWNWSNPFFFSCIMLYPYASSKIYWQQWCDFSSNRTSRRKNFEARSNRHQVGSWDVVWCHQLKFSLKFMVSCFAITFFSVKPHRDERSLNNIKETQVNAMHAETSRCLAENSKS